MSSARSSSEGEARPGAGVRMYRCARCGRVHFPRRPVCPGCHGTEFGEVLARAGVVEEVTTTSAGTIASVRTDLGPVVIAALATPRLEPGTEVSLASQPGGGAGYVPAPDHQEAR